MSIASVSNNFKSIPLVLCAALLILTQSTNTYSQSFESLVTLISGSDYTVKNDVKPKAFVTLLQKFGYSRELYMYNPCQIDNIEPDSLRVLLQSSFYKSIASPLDWAEHTRDIFKRDDILKHFDTRYMDSIFVFKTRDVYLGKAYWDHIEWISDVPGSYFLSVFNFSKKAGKEDEDIYGIKVLDSLKIFRRKDVFIEAPISIKNTEFYKKCTSGIFSVTANQEFIRQTGTESYGYITGYDSLKNAYRTGIYKSNEGIVTVNSIWEGNSYITYIRPIAYYYNGEPIILVGHFDSGWDVPVFASVFYFNGKRYQEAMCNMIR